MNSTSTRLHRPKMTALLVAVGCAFSCMLPQTSVAFPVAQEEMTGVADFGTGSGQSFLLLAGETILSIDLFEQAGVDFHVEAPHLDPAGGSAVAAAHGPYGNNAEVMLYVHHHDRENLQSSRLLVSNPL